MPDSVDVFFDLAEHCLDSAAKGGLQNSGTWLWAGQKYTPEQNISDSDIDFPANDDPDHAAAALYDYQGPVHGEFSKKMGNKQFWSGARQEEGGE